MGNLGILKHHAIVKNNEKTPETTLSFLRFLDSRKLLNILPERISLAGRLKCMKKRRVYPGQVHHVCQQTIGGVVIFYTLYDYLVFFTIYCTVARRYGIPVLALCPMADHTHNTVIVPDGTTLAKFVQQYTHLFAREWNESRGRRGPLFKPRFMSSAKLGNKQVRTTINYNYNNPVERKIVERAEDYRWNFARYAREKNPYSAPVQLAGKSARFRRILKEIKRICTGNGHLHYAQLLRWEKKLDAYEFRQIVDSIISLWNCIDYEEVIGYYGDYDAFLRSLHDNTGSDYEIKEDHDKYSDAVYQECAAVLLKEKIVKNLMDIPSLPENQKREAAAILRKRTSARPRQIEKYLHLRGDK